MRRRQVLQATAGFGLAGLAGCLGESGGSGEDPQATDSPTVSESPTPSGTPKISDHSFSVTRVESGETTQQAEITFEDSQIRVAGTTTGNNGCYTAVLGEKSVAEDTLSVTVVAKEDAGSDEMCTEALVQIDYEAVFTFDGRVPSQVEVNHDSLGETRTVAEKSQ